MCVEDKHHEVPLSLNVAALCRNVIWPLTIETASFWYCPTYQRKSFPLPQLVLHVHVSIGSLSPQVNTGASALGAYGNTRLGNNNGIVIIDDIDIGPEHLKVHPFTAKQICIPQEIPHVQRPSCLRYIFPVFCHSQ